MKAITRFAPSPTGLLHLGHAYAAKIAHQTARKTGGTFLLRQEDIDSSRVREEYYQLIETDLKWLGLTWDHQPLLQSTRLHQYAEILEKLKSIHLLYPCFCTRKEIQQNISNAPQGDQEPLYPKTCRQLSHHQIQEKIRNGHPHAWRLDSQKAAEIHPHLTFTDLEHGTIKVDPTINGDVILARKDLGIAYHLAVVIDDQFQKITHITRGKDLLTSTHIHRQLQEILHYNQPTYHHHKLIKDHHGKRLAKRHNSLSIKTLREQGHTPSQILKML